MFRESNFSLAKQAKKIAKCSLQKNDKMFSKRMNKFLSSRQLLCANTSLPIEEQNRFFVRAYDITVLYALSDSV